MSEFKQVAEARNSTVVPGQYLGYSLQTSRMLELLLGAGPGAVVSLEVIGDNAVQHTDGSVIAQESKSATSDSNPIADRSVGLWKTLSNWLDLVVSGQLDASRTEFRLYVSQPQSGRLARSFSEARDHSEAVAAIQEARATLLGGAGETAARPLGDTVRPYVTAFLAALEDRAAPIIANFQLVFGSGKSLTDLEASFVTKAVPPELVADVIEKMLGWIKARTDAQIERSEPATIPSTEFYRQMTMFVRKIDRRSMLTSFARDPAQAHIDEQIRASTYVRQLDLIEVDDDTRIAAVTDFLKAQVDRVAWAEKGHVFADSFDEFEADLRRAWQNLRQRCEVAHSAHPEVERGKILYADCQMHSAPLEGLIVPPHFSCGSFHKLADSLSIGWHPSYGSLLRVPVGEGPQ